MNEIAENVPWEFDGEILWLTRADGYKVQCQTFSKDKDDFSISRFVCIKDKIKSVSVVNSSFGAVVKWNYDGPPDADVDDIILCFCDKFFPNESDPMRERLTTNKERPSLEAIEAEADNWQAENQMPQLFGTEKQIRWAKVIRRAWYISQRHRKMTKKFGEEFSRWLLSKTAAGFWIGNQTLPAISQAFQDDKLKSYLGEDGWVKLV